ncbi:ABC transporter ATP-binding protein [Stagnihabitans tardus]|uniref:ATP-binding cassette domain-containing protein n=1 Tax=Stagnihabitans tardus TaxID=2699202 RepID=A0AAE4Y9H7_9RHOB|nr:ABC transporter ATP-binding protein [Stagnihabitans tardus]NBZ87759.1 ATP-binding cassette domain-containing protein [Stagnihabitans tardus]
MLEIKGLTVDFRVEGRMVRAVDGVSLSIAKGQVMGLVGESGSGKSQVLYALMGLLAENGRAGGQALFQGQDLLTMAPRALDLLRGKRIAMIFQDPMTALNPYQRVGDQLAEVLFHLPKAQAWERAVAMLERVKIPDAAARARRYPHEFSGGMRQRVMIAMALLAEPDLLLADEPTTALDVTIQAQILDLLGELAAETQTAILIVTHDLGVVARLCDRVTVLYGGRVMEEAGAEALFEAPRHPYSQGLLAATPRMEAPLAPRMTTIPGTPRAGAASLPGCPFAPRCALVTDRCRKETPQLIEGIACREVTR